MSGVCGHVKQSHYPIQWLQKASNVIIWSLVYVLRYFTPLAPVQKLRWMRSRKAQIPPHITATGRQLGSKKFTKATLPCQLNIGVLKIVVWDEGQGWSSGRAAAVWSTPAERGLGERARRWLGEGPEGQRREEAGGEKPLGIAIWWDCHSETVCGRCMRWDRQEHRRTAASGRLHKPHSKIIWCA